MKLTTIFTSLSIALLAVSVDAFQLQYNHQSLKLNLEKNQLELVSGEGDDFESTTDSYLVLASDSTKPIGNLDPKDPYLKPIEIKPHAYYLKWHKLDGEESIRLEKPVYVCATEEESYTLKTICEPKDSCTAVDQFSINRKSQAIKRNTYSESSPFIVKGSYPRTNQKFVLEIDSNGSVVFVIYDDDKPNRGTLFTIEDNYWHTIDNQWIDLDDDYEFFITRNSKQGLQIHCTIIGDNEFRIYDDWGLYIDLFVGPVNPVDGTGEFSTAGFDGFQGITGSKLTIEYVKIPPKPQEDKGPFWVQATTEENTEYYLHAGKEFVELASDDKDAAKLSVLGGALVVGDEEQWIKVSENKLKYSLEDDATSGWRINDDDGTLTLYDENNEEILFYACPVDDANGLVISKVKSTNKCVKLTSLKITDYYPPNEFLVPDKPIIISGELGSSGDNIQSVVLSTDGEQITVTTDGTGKDAAKFQVFDGILHVGESHFVSVKDGKLLIGDLEYNATPGWRVAGDVFYFNKNPITLFVCKSSVVSIEDGNGCEPLSNVVYENYEEPPQPLPTSEPFNIRATIKSPDTRVVFSMDNSYITVDDDPAEFVLVGNYLRVGDDKWVTVNAGVLSLVEEESDAVKGWNVNESGRKITFKPHDDDNDATFYVCKKENQFVVSMDDGDGCEVLEDIIATAPLEPNTIDTWFPMVVGVDDGDNVRKLSVADGRVIVVGSNDDEKPALFVIDNGYLKVNDNSWVKVESKTGALHVVNSVEDATREWALSNNQFMFNFEHVCFSECDTEDNFACVSKCDSSEKSIVTNYNPGPKDMHIESYIDEEEFTWSDDGSNILIDWDPTVFSIESRLLKVGDDKWAHMKTNGEISVVEDRKSATSGWYIDPSKKIKFNDRSGTNWNFYTCQDDENALVSKVYMGTSLQNGCAKMTGVVGKDIPTLPDATLNAGPFVITVGDAEEAEDLMRLSVDESRVTVSLDTQEFAVFELDNGYLKVRDEKWIKVNKDSSLLEVVDSEEDATEGWAIIEGKLYLDRKRGMKVNYSRVELSGCEEDADEQVVVYLGIRKGCARFKNVVIEEYTEPTPTPTPSETPVETEIETEPEYVEEITTNDEDFDDITTEGELVEEITTEGELIEEITTEGDGGGVDETTTPEPEITTPEVDPTPTDNEEASIIEEEETNTTGDGDEDVISTENEGGEETTTAEEPETTTAEEPETTTPEAETETAEVESTTVEEEETTTTGDGDDDVISTDNEDDENSTVNEEATTIEEEETTTTDDDDEDVTPTGEDDDDNPTGEDGDEETTTTDDGDVNVTPTGEDGDADATPTDEEEEATTIDDEEVATDEEEEEEEVTPNDGNQSSSTNDNQSSTIEISTETDEETAEYVSDVSSSISMETSTSVAPTIDPSGPIMIKVIHEEEKWFSMVSSNIGVSDVQSASLFRVEDGYLIIDDSHYIKVESNGLLVAVDHKNETSPEWTLIDGVLYYDFHEHVNFFSILQEAVFSACDKDGNTLVFVGSKAECDSLSVVVVEGVTTPDSTIDPNDPANNVPDSTNDPSEPTDDESDPTDDESESINDESDSTNYVSGSINDESDSTNYASDSTNYSSDPTGEVSDSTNEVSDSTDEASDPTDDPSDSTSDQSECTGEPSESTNDSSESINEPSDSTNNQPDSTNEPFESAYSVENMTEDPKESGGWNSLTDSLEESEAPEGSKTENISEASQDTENETNVSSSEVKSSSGHISNTSSTKFNNSATDDITSATNYSTNIVDQSTVISDENTSDNPTTIANQSVVVSEDKKSNSGVNTYITETICDASAGCTEIVKSAEVVYVTTTDEIIVTETKCENVSECHIVTTVKTSSYSTIAYTTYLPVVVESDKESVVVETEIENHDMFMDTITTMITCIGTVCEHSVTNVNEELEAMSDMALDVAEENASSALQNENPVINSSLEMINVGDTVRSFSMISSTSMLAVLFLLVFV